MWVDDELVIIGTDLPTGHVYAFEKATGKVRWKQPMGLGVATDIVGSRESVFALSKEGVLSSLDRRTGEVLWAFRTSGAESGPSNPTSPALSEGRVFFSGLDDTVYALDAATGEVLWTRTLESPVSTKMLSLAEGVYYGSGDGQLHRVDPATGDSTACLDVGGVPRGTVATTDQSLFVRVAGDRGVELVSVDRELETVRWRQPAPASAWTPHLPFVWQGKVLVGGPSGSVVGHRANDGTPEWSLQLAGYVKVVGSNGELFYVANQEGSLFVHQEN